MIIALSSNILLNHYGLLNSKSNIVNIKEASQKYLLLCVQNLRGRSGSQVLIPQSSAIRI
jgi:hypothetical protein